MDALSRAGSESIRHQTEKSVTARRAPRDLADRTDVCMTGALGGPAITRDSPPSASPRAEAKILDVAAKEVVRRGLNGRLLE